MSKDRFERLNKLLIVTDLFDDPDDPDTLAGVAINVDDMDDFIKDVEKLAVEKYGGATFPELLDEDIDDTVNDRAIAQSRKEMIEHVVEAAESITKQALGKRGIVRKPNDNPIEFFLREYLDEFKRGIASESLMEDAYECGIATLAVEFRTEGLDEEDIEKAPEDFVAMLSLIPAARLPVVAFQARTLVPRHDQRLDRLGRHVPIRLRLLEDLGKTNR
jgi:hypothetical protein